MEQELFTEIPNRVFDSAVLTTFSFNSYFFQQQAVKELGRKGVFNIAVLTDAAMLTEHLQHMAKYENHEERYYGITGIPSKGAFHPKLNYFIGKNALLCIVGSGNLTSSGHGKNKEVFTTLYADHKNQQHLPLLQQIWHYIETIGNSLRGISKQQIIAMKAECNLLNSPNNTIQTNTFITASKNTEVAFLHEKKEAELSEQLYALLPKKVNVISVIAPYYDTKGEMLLNMRKHFRFPLTRIVLQNNFGLHPSGMKDFTNLKIYDWNKVGQGLVSKGDKQNILHAKIFLFDTDNYKYCLIGSANPSLAAFGGSNLNSKNQEACLLLRSKNRSFCNELGVKFSGIATCKLENFIHPPLLSNSNEGGTKSNKIHILSSEKSISHIDVFLSTKPTDNNFAIALLNKKGEILYRFESKTLSDRYNPTIDDSILKDAQQVVILDKQNREISNRQFLQNTEKIQRQNPSIKNKFLNNILDRVGLNLQPLDYLELLTDTNNYSRNESKSSTSVGNDPDNKVSALDKKINQEEISHKTYEEFISEVKNRSISFRAHAQASYNKVQILDLLLNHFNEFRERKEQEEIDLEEEEKDIDQSFGVSDKSVDAPAIKSLKMGNTPPKPIDVSKARKKIVALVDYYKNSLNTLSSHSQSKLNMVDLVEFILIMKLLIDCADYEVETELAGRVKPSIQYILPTKSYTTELHSFSHLTLSVIQKFSEYAGKLDGTEDYSDNQYFLEKFERYLTVANTYSLLALSFLSLVNPKDDFLKNRIEQVLLNLIRLLNIKQDFVIAPENLDITIKTCSIIEFKKEQVLEEIAKWLRYGFSEYISGSKETVSGKYSWDNGMGYSIFKKVKPKK